MRYKDTILEKINYTSNIVNNIEKEVQAGKLSKETLAVLLNSIRRNQETLKGLVELEK